MTYFCLLPNSDPKVKLIAKREDSSHAHLHHKASKQKTDLHSMEIWQQTSYEVNSILLQQYQKASK